MALINCPECTKQISDQCEACPNCGYKMKKKIKKINIKEIGKSFASIFKEDNIYSIFGGKIKLSSMQIISLLCIVCSLILSFITNTISKDTYTIPGYTRYSLYSISYYDLISAIEIYSIIVISLGVLSMVSIIIYNCKKISKNILVYIPNVLYTLVTVGNIIAVLAEQFDSHGSYITIYYGLYWGAVYMLILVVLSFVLLLIEVIRDKKKNKVKRKLPENLATNDNI